MILIVESGATKSDWRVISKDGKEMKRIITEGVNVSTMRMDAIKNIISDTAEQLAQDAISEIYFYTAGVVTDEIAGELEGILKQAIPDATCDIQNDLTAAARAVCGHSTGIAAILGTGSNSCLFDGEKIIQRVYSCGYILGDEGSAAALGKFFIADFLKGLVPADIAADFAERYDSDYATIVQNVYRSETSPSGYLGSFAPFIMEHYSDRYIQELVEGNFRSFIRRSLKQYDTERHPIGVVGGFGYALKDIFAKVAEEEGVKISRFIKEPIDGLIAYHLEESDR
jgi:N-acetylglucosamine kinase-like BadF-type ATPase